MTETYILKKIASIKELFENGDLNDLDGEVELILNKIYEDGFEDGMKESNFEA